MLSMGFLQPEHYINEALGLDIDERGNFRATKQDYRTSVPKVLRGRRLPARPGPGGAGDQ